MISFKYTSKIYELLNKIFVSQMKTGIDSKNHIIYFTNLVSWNNLSVQVFRIS
jgi:hypothetical protein